MLSQQQWLTINSLVDNLNPAQRLWLSGYLAGMENTPQSAHTPTIASASEVAPATMTVAYGSQSGNGEQVAADLAQALGNAGNNVRLLSLADYKTAFLKKEQLLFIVISTQGEGDPPDDAKVFYDFLHSARAPKLPNLKYAVLALGDSSYDFFCKTGKDIAERLQALDATALQPCVECDTDYEEQAATWQQALVESTQVPQQDKAPNGDMIFSLPDSNNVTSTTNATPTRAQPFAAPVIESILLTKPPRRTMHIELALENSNLQYQPGDSLGIRPQNSIATAEKTAAALGLAWQQQLTIGNDTASVGEWMLKHLDINRPTATALQRYQKIVNNAQLGALLTDNAALANYIRGRDYSDVFADFPPPEAQHTEALACLRRLAPRLYSLASSNTLREDEAHLLVAVEDYRTHDGGTRHGVCSHYLATRQIGDTVDVYLQRNQHFRLPTNENTPVIMIGPGTGVAPFRAFMEERELAGGGGDNWLFFGNRNRREEFYYQTEWQAYQKSGVLTHLTVAFSREGKNKVYVQDKLQQHSATLWQWLQNDAHVYICGDSKMAAEVHTRLAEIISTNKSSGGNGNEYLQTMQQEGRYQRDIY